MKIHNNNAGTKKLEPISQQQPAHEEIVYPTQVSGK